jgi:hypothetical protein
VRSVADAAAGWPLAGRLAAEVAAALGVVAVALAWALWWADAIPALRRFAGLLRWRQRVFGDARSRS